MLLPLGSIRAPEPKTFRFISLCIFFSRLEIRGRICIRIYSSGYSWGGENHGTDTSGRGRALPGGEGGLGPETLTRMHGSPRVALALNTTLPKVRVGSRVSHSGPKVSVQFGSLSLATLRLWKAPKPRLVNLSMGRPPKS